MSFQIFHSLLKPTFSSLRKYLKKKIMKRLSIIGEVLQKASNWFRENLPLKSPNSSAEEVSAHDVDEGMETENRGFTSSIALQYVSQAQVGLTCDLAWNPKPKCLKFRIKLTITSNSGRGDTIHQWEDRDRQGGWEEGGWLKDVAESENPRQRVSNADRKVLQIRKVFSTSSSLAEEFPDTLQYKISR